MRHLGMLNKSRSKGHSIERFIARQSGWVRAPESGFVTHLAQLGDHVEKGDKLAIICHLSSLNEHESIDGCISAVLHVCRRSE